VGEGVSENNVIFVSEYDICVNHINPCSYKKSW
jgi:hypothetical protein